MTIMGKLNNQIKEKKVQANPETYTIWYPFLEKEIIHQQARLHLDVFNVTCVCVCVLEACRHS